MPQAISYAGWDELTEGAERELTMGPLTRTDFVRFAGANGDFNPNHHDDTYAAASDFPSAFAPGMLQGGYVGKILSEWVGPRALRTFRIRFSAQAWPGDMVICKAKVVRRYEEGGERRVEIEAVAENQDGATLIKAHAAAAPQD
ncbi:MAG: MaoC/PaaZ C-terminal domain-containing protein [bacterium]